jgi:hypothetical protein
VSSGFTESVGEPLVSVICRVEDGVKGDCLLAGGSIPPLHLAKRSSGQGAGLCRVSPSQRPGAEITRFTLRTLCGKTVPSLKRGPNLRLSVPRIVGQGTTSRCIWITHSTSGLKFGRRTERPRNGLSASCCYEHHRATDTLDWNKSLSSWLGVRKSGGSHGSNNAGSHG